MTRPLPLAIGLSAAATGDLTPAEWRALAAPLDGAAEFVTIAEDFTAEAPASLEALTFANWFGAQTRNLGILAGAALNVVEPFHVSTAVATLDYVARGRAGLLLQPATPAQAESALEALGRPATGYPPPEAEALAQDLAEALEAIRQLWDSWREDAIIRDSANHRFLDADRLRHIDFQGRFFSVSGPSITPRPPQGQPVVAATLAAPETKLDADLVFLPPEAFPVGAWEGPRLYADLSLAFEEGAPQDLAARLAALRPEAAAGWRLTPQDPRRDLPKLLEILPELRAAGLIAAPGSGLLRDRLGLAPALDRFAA